MTYKGWYAIKPKQPTNTPGVRRWYISGTDDNPKGKFLKQ